MKIISGSSNVAFAQSLAQHLQLPLGKVDISTFANGEKRVWVEEDVKGENVILVQSFGEPTDQHIMEFLLLADALERAGVRHINAVIPWLGYSLQDKVFRPGEPIAAKVVADLISHSYIKRAFLFDLHNTSTPGFFSIPVQHLNAHTLFADYVKKTFDLNNSVVASPDFGGLKRARVFAELLDLPLVKIDKKRDLNTGDVTALGIQGEVKNKNVIIIDDIINTGSTVVSAAAILKENGSQSVHFLASHGPLVATAHQKLHDSALDSIVVTNSIAQVQENDKIIILDAAPLFATELKTWM